jgi:hypothetical protein
MSATLRHQLVEAAVLFKQRWQLGLHHPPHGILTRLQWQTRVQASNCVLETLLQHDLIVTLALRSMTIGADVLLAFDAVSQPSQLFQ